MKDILSFILSLIFAYFACMGFTLIFHIRGKIMFIAPIGGVIQWATYMLLDLKFSNQIIRTFIATVIAAIFCEILARILKVPVTVLMVIAILPLVPGSGIYYTMEYCINSDYQNFISTGVNTIGIACAIAFGMLLISSVFSFATKYIRRYKAGKA